MAEHVHDPAAPRPEHARPVRRPEAPPGHPLLDLQQQAGNAALAQLLTVQRHTLDPDEEAGS